MKNCLEMIRRARAFGVACFFIFGCSKPAQSPSVEQQPDSELPTVAPMVRSEPAATTSPSVNEEPNGQSGPQAGEPPSQTAGSLQQKFFNTENPNERREIVFALGELNSVEALTVLGTLFQNERDEKLKVDILATIEQMEVPDAHKVSIMIAAARPEQPQEVREEAIDALADLQDPAVLPMLQMLTSDPNAEIRQTAKDALDDIAETGDEPSP
jgi:HEAT repeat protein